jgi:peroxiredoxin
VTRSLAAGCRSPSSEQLVRVAETAWTVLYCFPGPDAPGGRFYPPNWGDIPGAPDCTLESLTYGDRHSDFAAVGATVHGVSTQCPDQLAAFAEYVDLPFALLSDTDLALAASLRLPTFRAAGMDRLKRLTMIVDDQRTIRAAQFPVTDPAASVG